MFELGDRVRCVVASLVPNRFGYIGTAVAVSGRRIKVLFDCDRKEGDPLVGENLASAIWLIDIEIERARDELPFEAFLSTSYRILAYLVNNTSGFRWDVLRSEMGTDENCFRNAMVYLMRHRWVRCYDRRYRITPLGIQKFWGTDI